MPKLKPAPLLILVSVQIINPVQAGPRMGNKQLAHDILDRKRRKPRPARPADIVKDEVLERQALRIEVRAHNRIQARLSLGKAANGPPPARA